MNLKIYDLILNYSSFDCLKITNIVWKIVIPLLKNFQVNN